MKSKRCFKKMVTGLSVVAMSVSVVVPALPVMAEEQRVSEVQEEKSLELTYEKIKEYHNVLYTVNCGTPDPSVIPNESTERMGVLQSNVDQGYGVDEGTGITWGRDVDNENSASINAGDDATDIGNSYIYMSDQINFDKYKSALGYSFEVPKDSIEGIEDDTYEVTVAFKHYWDDRWVNIMLEGQTVATDVSVGYGEWVCKTFTTKVTDGELNVQIRSPRRWSSKQDPILNYIKVKAVDEQQKEIPSYNSITGVAGDTMYDTNGNQIQAHGGQIQQLTVDGKAKWYWIGEDKTNDYRPVGGIHMYSSEDLYNWNDEGVVLRAMEDPAQFESDPYFNELYGEDSAEQKENVFIDLDKNNCVMERPKMIYNDKTGKYVIWFHADGRSPGNDADYGKAKAGIAISDSPTGPFKLLGSYKLNYHNDPNADHGFDGWGGRGSVRDMNLFKDDDGTAYVIYSSEGNKTMFVSKLNDDYTGLEVPREEAVEGVNFTRNFVGWSREAPAMFKYRDKYYVVTSGCTGWSPNQAKYAVADHPMGPWTEIGDPCVDWGNWTTYDTQSTCVFPVDAENGKYIYMGDRWNSGDLSESRYVWTPVEFQSNNKIAIRRYENWTLDDLKGKGYFEVVSDLPTTVSAVSEIMDQLPDEVTISYGTEEETTPVTWNIGHHDEKKIGEVKVTGNLTETGKSFTHVIRVVNPDTLYFFDSGAESSEYFDTVKKELGNKVKNDVADQKYSNENKAGYTGVTKSESSDSFDLALHEGGSYLENGWWAAGGKNIAYDFQLQPGTYMMATGFREWWNVNRDMKINITMGDQILAEQDFRLSDYDRDLQINQSFTITEAGKVTVTISKTGSSDPVLSWIGIIGEESDEPSADVDSRNLELAVTMAEKMEQEQEENNCYSADSWATVQEALDRARTLLANPDATQEALDSTFLELITACNLLEDGVQKVGLKAAIEGTKAILADEAALADYTAESVEAVRTALIEAENVFAEGSADQGTVNNASRNLMDAVTSMLVKDETTRLGILIQKAEELLKQKDKYTASSIQKLEEALEAAKIVDNSQDTSEQESSAAYEKLAKAMTSLVRIGSKEELRNALDKANEILNESGRYLEASIAGLQAVTDEAQQVFNSDDADLDAVSEVLKNLINEILKARLMGDVNMDRSIDTKDSAEVLKSAAELKGLTEEQRQVADVNGDGSEDSNDAAAILQYASEKIMEF
ncbi:family 43 glycosylhydrolase [Robinsoniella peoriensis]|uniref:family 43 glycosylhydrolase n=1 Tax=Robinsoniella peoriensis TaxID=180332 RepID=UPI0037516D47